MRPTGPRSRTEPVRWSHAAGRPEPRSGRSRVDGVVLGTILAVASVCLPPSTAEAFELLAWWKRGLLELRLEPGDWARYAITETGEEGTVQDTLQVTVLAAGDDARRWLKVEGDQDAGMDFLLVDPVRLQTSGHPLDAVLRVVRLESDGTWHEEDLAEHRENRIVQRHLEDPFHDPHVQRTALADTLVEGRRITRERVLLTEVRREERKAGRNVLVLETDLRSSAQLSADVPVAGLLEARTVTLFRTRTQTPDGQSLGRGGTPPLLSERTLRCLAFGRLHPPPAVPVPR
jgi:hypothetical protein